MARPTFQNTFTGKDTAVTLPDSGRLDRAQERLSNTIIDADKIKYDAFKENEKWLLEQGDVDLAPLISAGATAAMAGELEQFNKDITTLTKGKNLSNLPLQDKQEIMRRKNILESRQNKYLGDQQKYQMAEQAVRNSDKYDKEEFYERWGKPMATTGVFNEEPLPVKAIDPSLYYTQRRNKIYGTQTSGEAEFRVNQYGVREEKKPEYSASPEEAKAAIAADIYSNEGLRKGYFNEFVKLPKSEQLKYLDANKDGTISENEKKALGSNDEFSYNPIVAYAQDKYLNTSRYTTGQFGAPTSVPGSGSTSDMKTFKYGTGSPTKYTPVEAIPTTIGSTSYQKYHPFGQFETYYIPSESIDIKNTNGNREFTTNKSLRVIPLGYDEVTDEFIFKVTQNYKSQGSRGNGDEIAVKRSKLPSEFGDIQVMVNKKPTLIRDVPRDSKPTEGGSLDNL